MRTVREENVPGYSTMYVIIIKKFLAYSLIPIAAFKLSTCYTVYKYKQQHGKHNAIF